MRVDADGPSRIASSDGFDAALEARLFEIARRFGTRPGGVACSGAVFTLPVDRGTITVVQVSDDPVNTAAPTLRFRFLLLRRHLYEGIGDPFQIVDRFPLSGSPIGHLPTLEWPNEPLPPRRVEPLHELFEKRGDLSLILGSVQALIDGGRVLLIAPAPNPEFLRDVWALLPDRTRWELRVASLAFSNDLDFQAVVLPEAPTPWPLGYLSADQLRDYPEGRYERNLQIAVESKNQTDLDSLFARRSSSDTLRLGLYILGFAMLLTILLKLV